MKVIFNNKEYRKNGNVTDENGDGLGRLCFDIFKHYLKMNPEKTYKELQKIFNTSTIHKQLSGLNSKRKVVFNKEDFENWYKNYAKNDSTAVRPVSIYFVKSLAPDENLCYNPSATFNISSMQRLVARYCITNRRILWIVKNKMQHIPR